MAWISAALGTNVKRIKLDNIAIFDDAASPDLPWEAVQPPIIEPSERLALRPRSG
jgi:hypothetical protein